MPAGRPSSYNEETATRICDEIASGKSVREICAADDMPAMSTVFLWLSKHGEFSERYARAKEVYADVLGEELLELSDDGTNDWMERRNQDGECVGWTVNGEAVQRSKLRADTRKWLMGKLAAKKYGERITQEVTGKGGERLIPETNELEVARRVAFILAQGLAKAE